MKRWTILTILSGLLGGCTNPVVDPGSATHEDQPTSAESPLTTGEVYRSSDNQACSRNGDSYLCLILQNYEGAVPNIWRARVCKMALTADPFEVERMSFGNPIKWKMVASRTQLGADFFYKSEYLDSCTETQEIDLQGLPCNKLTLLEAQVTSPATCADPGCLYRTGSLTVMRSCPAEY